MLNLDALLDPKILRVGDSSLWLSVFLTPCGSFSLSCPVSFWLCPFPPSSTFPPQGCPLLLSWPPAAHCEVGSRPPSWVLAALLSLALMQVDFKPLLLAPPPSLPHVPFSIPTSSSSQVLPTRITLKLKLICIDQKPLPNLISVPCDT